MKYCLMSAGSQHKTAKDFSTRKFHELQFVCSSFLLVYKAIPREEPVRKDRMLKGASERQQLCNEPFCV